jgi:predicted SAM-dependent methyltransferase
LREVAGTRAATSSGVSFVEGLAADLPFLDGSVDVLWCERVLQHLADPQRRSRSSPACCVSAVALCSSTPTMPRG